MMTACRVVFLFGLTTIVIACATATPYQPEAKGYGYSERKVEPNRYTVTFTGNSQTPRKTVEDYLLYRAAEVTLANGYDYFVLAEQNTEADTRYSHFVDYTGFGFYRWGPSFGTGVGVGTTTSTTTYEGKADIVMYKGNKAPENVKAFDARHVKQSIEPRLTRPGQAS
jgi:hypothetical protein